MREGRSDLRGPAKMSLVHTRYMYMCLYTMHTNQPIVFFSILCSLNMVAKLCERNVYTVANTYCIS